jgi:hypothetical protein
MVAMSAPLRHTVGEVNDVDHGLGRDELPDVTNDFISTNEPE